MTVAAALMAAVNAQQFDGPIKFLSTDNDCVIYSNFTVYAINKLSKDTDYTRTIGSKNF